MNRDFILKRSMARAFAVFVAVIIAYFFARGEKCWLIITSILVMQTAVGVTLRQGMERFNLIFISVAMGTFLVIVLQKSIVLDALTVIIFCLCCYLAKRSSSQCFVLTGSFLFGLIILIAMLLPALTTDLLYGRLYDITLGAVIGIVINLIIFPRRADEEFRGNIIPLLNTYSDYLSCIFNLLFHEKDSEKNAYYQRMNVENILQAQSAFFPIWVYESGLSVTLQPGHRHFLMMVERVGQILLSMHQTARQPIDNALLQTLHDPLIKMRDQIKKIIAAMVTVLNLKKLQEKVSDLTEELNQLEEAYKSAVPLPLELLDMSKEYVYLAAFVQDLKDMRETLIRLGKALRG